MDGGGPEVAFPGTLIIFPDVKALAPGAMGTLICCVVGAKLTVCNGVAGSTVMRVFGIRICDDGFETLAAEAIFWLGGVMVTCL